MPERDDPRPSSREVAGEDFLYHLHRGSELLQDNRVHAAKAEIERALSMQPSDPKGQDLLGIVYFRLGLYPRAIAIYERLIQTHPDAIEPRINLALSYLKTGQPSQARTELERVLEQNPRHQRAWGYLGLAFQRLGDVERAAEAFAAGGHDAMARRCVPSVPRGGPGPLAPPGEARRGPTPLEPQEAPIASPSLGTASREAADDGELTPLIVCVQTTSLAARSAPTLPAVPSALTAPSAPAVPIAPPAPTAFRRGDSELPRIPSGTWAAFEPQDLPAMPPPSNVRRPSALFEAIQAAAAIADDVPASRRHARAAAATDAGAATSARAVAATDTAAGANVDADADADADADTVAGPEADKVASAATAATAATDTDTAAREATVAAVAAATVMSAPISRQIGPPSSQTMPAFAARAPDSPLGFARERLLGFPRDLAVAQHPAGLVLVQAPKGFATRLEAILALTTGPAIPARALPRQTRGRTLDEPLGGAVSPICELGGRCELVLRPPEGRRLHALLLTDEPVYLREDALLGFELTVVYENGRLAIGDGEATSMVQLRGRGALVALLPEQASTIEVMAGRSTVVRAGSVIGWLGRLVPRALPPSEAFLTMDPQASLRAPDALRGFVAFAGEGMVIVDGR